jgi:hypothetical protein
VPSNPRRVMRGLVSAGAVVALLLALAAPAGAASDAIGLAWFLRGGAPVPVARAAPTVPALVGALLAGPRAGERARGIETAIPARTSVRSVVVRKRIATVDLTAAFAAGIDRDALRARMGQLVRTVLSVPGVRAVRVRIEGGVPVGLFPGYDPRRTITAPLETAPRPPTTRDLQQALVDLGFMDRRGITGQIDGETSNAVLAFQKWSGLPRDGVITPATQEALFASLRPRPALRAPGRRIEVHLGRQLALLIDNGRVVRLVHVSSGAGGKTPLGTFHVYRKERYSWSVPFSVWLPWASYFVGGVAFHEFGSVPTYAASHGCVRVSHYDAEMLYEFATFGTQVDVFQEVRA